MKDDNRDLLKMDKNVTTCDVSITETKFTVRQKISIVCRMYRIISYLLNHLLSYLRPCIDVCLSLVRKTILVHICLTDFPILINWTSPFFI